VASIRQLLTDPEIQVNVPDLVGFDTIVKLTHTQRHWIAEHNYLLDLLAIAIFSFFLWSMVKLQLSIFFSDIIVIVKLPCVGPGS